MRQAKSLQKNLGETGRIVLFPHVAQAREGQTRLHPKWCAEPRPGADWEQRPLVPRSRSSQQLRPGVRPHGIMRPAQLSLAFFGLCLLAACAAPLGVSTEDLSRMQECKAGFGSSSANGGARMRQFGISERRTRAPRKSAARHANGGTGPCIRRGAGSTPAPTAL